MRSALMLAAAVLSVAVTGSANANTTASGITVKLSRGNNGTFNNNNVGDMTGVSSAIYNGKEGPIEFVAGMDTSGVSVGTTPMINAMPLGDNTNYLWGVNAGSTVFFGSANAPVKTRSFLINWGSIDALSVAGYDNVLTLSTGAAITGDDLVSFGLAVGDGNQFNPMNNRWFRISVAEGDEFEWFTVTSAKNAFEFDMATVPEPATWAMLIAGFGLVGFAMRRQRAAVARVAA